MMYDIMYDIYSMCALLERLDVIKHMHYGDFAHRNALSIWLPRESP